MSAISFIKKHTKLMKVNFEILVAFLTSFVGLNSTAVVAFAAGKGSGGNKGGSGVGDAGSFTAYTGGPGNVNTLTNIFAGFIPTLQGLGAVLLIIFAIILGIKIGMSAVTSDPRGREGALVGLFFIILAGVVIIHAKQIVGMSAGVTGV